MIFSNGARMKKNTPILVNGHDMQPEFGYNLLMRISRRHIIRLHKPHPANMLKRYQVDQIIDELVAQEDLP